MRLDDSAGAIFATVEPPITSPMLTGLLIWRQLGLEIGQSKFVSAEMEESIGMPHAQSINADKVLNRCD